MSSNKEWRQHKLKSLERFKGFSFQLADYIPPSTDWDHDHCEGCWSKFASFEGPEILHNGYFTIVHAEDESIEEPEFVRQAQELGNKVLAKPDSRNWICRECFEEFCDILNWKVIS